MATTAEQQQQVDFCQSLLIKDPLSVLYYSLFFVVVQGVPFRGNISNIASLTPFDVSILQLNLMRVCQIISMAQRTHPLFIHFGPSLLDFCFSSFSFSVLRIIFPSFCA